MELVTRKITYESIDIFKERLIASEKSKHTIEKYICDIKKLKNYAKDEFITQELLIKYKTHLEAKGYKITSINSYLASINKYCKIMGFNDLQVKMLKVQKNSFLTENEELTKSEYMKLVECALEKGDVKLSLIIQTIASTGIRISELQFITIESLTNGMADIHNKGKIRRILYPTDLVKVLTEYAKDNNITKGAIFITQNGNPMNRSNIWKMMKKLCEKAHIEKEKVYPHNMRHLFAKCFYEQKPDIAKLADVLGHSNIETTRIYIKSTGKEHQKLLDDMKMIKL